MTADTELILYADSVGGGGGASWGESSDNTFYAGTLTPVAIDIITYNGTYKSGGTWTRTIGSGDNKIYSYTFKATQYKVTKNTEIVRSGTSFVGQVIYQVTCSVSGFPAYYVNSFAGSWYRMTSNDLYLSTGSFNPEVDIGYDTTFDGDNWASWLVSTGQAIITNNPIIDFMELEIGGVSLWYILVGGGIMIYVSWTLVKWLL